MGAAAGAKGLTLHALKLTRARALVVTRIDEGAHRQPINRRTWIDAALAITVQETPPAAAAPNAVDS
jgi:hypothetical protein